MSNTKPPLSVVPEAEEDEWEGERTTPGWAQRITIGDLYRALARLESAVGRMARAVKWLSVSVGALALVTFFLWWMR